MPRRINSCPTIELIVVALTLLTCTREVFCSNLGRNSGCPDGSILCLSRQISRWYLQPVPSKCFSIHHSSIVLTFDALLCGLNTNRAVEQTMENYKHDPSGTLMTVSVHRFNYGDTDGSLRNLVVTECHQQYKHGGHTNL
jgi:hypothetical protein